jgi:hypothetical protein
LRAAEAAGHGRRAGTHRHAQEERLRHLDLLPVDVLAQLGRGRRLPEDVAVKIGSKVKNLMEGDQVHNLIIHSLDSVQSKDAVEELIFCQIRSSFSSV